MILVTSCPECKTTFRISVGILEKAGGQVRCGRCARIFDANAKLREVDESEVESRPAPSFKFQLQPDPEIGATAESFDEGLGVREGEPLASGGDLPEREEYLPEDELAEDDLPEHQLPEDELPEGELPEAAAPEAVLRESSATAEFRELPDWLRPAAESLPGRDKLWAAGVALATLALVGQLVHHYRAELAGVPALGPALTLAYAGFGAELRPPVDLGQYELRDLTAVAEPAGDDQGWLVIETRVHNTGPAIQPYPHIFVRLLDRWEDTVAARYFGPEEYAVTSIRNIDRMNAGSTIDAQFIIMDPGPSATGFELELCIESTRGFECESDITGD